MKDSLHVPFLRAISDNPLQEEPRIEYAKWLESRGEIEWLILSEGLRAEVEVRNSVSDREKFRFGRGISSFDYREHLAGVREAQQRSFRQKQIDIAGAYSVPLLIEEVFGKVSNVFDLQFSGLFPYAIKSAFFFSSERSSRIAEARDLLLLFPIVQMFGFHGNIVFSGLGSEWEAAWSAWAPKGERTVERKSFSSREALVDFVVDLFFSEEFMNSRVEEKIKVRSLLDFSPIFDPFFAADFLRKPAEEMLRCLYVPRR